MKETVNCGFWVSISFKKLGLKSFTEYQHSKLIILIICSDPNSISHKPNLKKLDQSQRKIHTQNQRNTKTKKNNNKSKKQGLCNGGRYMYLSSVCRNLRFCYLQSSLYIPHRVRREPRKP